MSTPTTTVTAPDPVSPPAIARRPRLGSLAVLAAAGALTACGTDHPLAPVAQRPATVAPVATSATDAGTAGGSTAEPGDAGAASAPAQRPAGQHATTPSGGGSTSGGHGGGDNPAVPAPGIASFRVIRQPVCAVRGTPDAPYSTPGSGVTIAWSVTGTDGAALAVDDPTTYGAYGTSYPAEGQQEFPFTCTPGTTTSHTFTVWPAGAKGTSKTLTVSARSDG